MSTASVTPVVAVLVIAAVLTGFTGFGFNLLAVPLLALWINVTDAIVLALVVGTVLSLSAGIAGRREIHHPLLRTLLLGSVPGLAAGMLLVSLLDDRTLRLVAGLVTVAAAVLLAPTGRRARLPPSAATGLGVGAVSGGLTSLLGMGGPPVVAYLLARADAAHRIRSTLLAYVGVTGALAITLRGSTGHLHADQLATSAALLVPAGLGLFLGTRVYRALPSWHAATSIATLAFLGCLGVAVALGVNFAPTSP